MINGIRKFFSKPTARQIVHDYGVVLERFPTGKHRGARVHLPHDVDVIKAALVDVAAAPDSGISKQSALDGFYGLHSFVDNIPDLGNMDLVSMTDRVIEREEISSEAAWAKVSDAMEIALAKQLDALRDEFNERLSARLVLANA